MIMTRKVNITRALKYTLKGGVAKCRVICRVTNASKVERY